MRFLHNQSLAALSVELGGTQCLPLPLVIASPDLLTVKCYTEEQMALVSLLCWVAEETGS